MPDIKTSPLGVFLFFLGILMFFFILGVYSVEPTFERASYAAQIITTFTLGAAYLEFKYKRKRDKVSDTIELISYFRNEVLPSSRKLSQILFPSPSGKEEIPRIKMEKFKYEWIHAFGGDNFYNQDKLFDEALEREQSKTAEAIIELGNSLEEFALRVYFTESAEKEELYSIRDAYIEIVERAASRILWVNLLNQNTYKTVGRLYMDWRPFVDDEPAEQKINRLINEFVSSLDTERMVQVRAEMKRRDDMNAAAKVDKSQGNRR